ncbi:thioredoxin-like protein [Frankia casuarinae]|uniref:Nitrogen-fixing NifU-like n=1 Tax=Frankia casuarinae (strain DSM 45818 / CECT 9043 / HFP020203 / CcI3) TaxID=106370 RepID=Q2JBM4_FRACC|nr:MULTISPECIES: NifU family protein [Frankia]ABD11318.1 nitrogen-fixing NifU-like [Frankia casuarinae]ETA00640.1 thioredoxin-like protein [Frankia sp. CcI6]EYT90754.1 thioredoxin-like protein [Frankia casuarinae]KDA41596.1 thioredoxin-like protein [Frankia sp. BMG5.23]KEZ35088.1 thioredoxin-like protein [Frankia sp. CeD]
MVDPDGAGGHRLDDLAVRGRLAHLDEVLAQVERIPGPSGELAIDAVATLAAVYGEALARAVGYASGAPEVLAAFTGDELLDHLLVLHDVHPEPVGARVARAIEQLRPAVRDRGGEIELSGIERGVAEVRLTLGGCGSTSAGVTEAVRQAVLAVAPELSDVRRLPAPGEPERTAFVPLDTVLARPVADGVGP